MGVLVPGVAPVVAPVQDVQEDEHAGEDLPALDVEAVDDLLGVVVELVLPDDAEPVVVGQPVQSNSPAGVTPPEGHRAG